MSLIEFAWLQEREYLKNYIGRIAAVEPDIVLVERTVSRVAQELILATGITLVTNVKPVSAGVATQPLMGRSLACLPCVK